MTTRNNTILAEEVRAALEYFPETGEFRWRWREGVLKKINTQYAGTIAGGVNNRGYMQIKLKGVLYKAHRLAWLIMTEAWPPNDIDHINGIRDDNRFENLRLATRQENTFNSPTRANNTSGAPGVCWVVRLQKWRARINVNRENTHLGLFTEKADAIAARHAAEVKYFGAFRRAA
jgi:hypothetical protein